MFVDYYKNKDGSRDKRFSWKCNWYVAKSNDGKEYLTSKPEKYCKVEDLIFGTYKEAKSRFDRRKEIRESIKKSFNL